MVAIIGACIGGFQAALLSFVVPCLAEMLTSHKHGYTTLANLLLNCVLPATAIIGLGLTFESARKHT